MLATAYVALGSAWLGSNPPATGSDEGAHYLRALAIGMGDFLGQPITSIQVSPPNPAQQAHLLRTTRSVMVPAGLAVPTSWDCTLRDFSVSARCASDTTTNESPVRQASTEAGSLPYLYIPPGLAMRLAGDATQALFLGRIAGAVITYGLLVAAILLLWDGLSPLSLLGVPLAVTPTFISVGAAMGPSGPEIGAAAALMAFLLRLSRTGESPGWAWALGIVACAVLNLARPLGLVWNIAILLVAFSLAGRRALLSACRKSPRACASGAAILIATAVLSVGWELAVFPPEPHSLSQVAAFVLPSLGAVPEIVSQAVGTFIWADNRVPVLMDAIWSIALISLIAPALLRGRLRERRTLDGLLIGMGFAIILVSAVLVMPVGYGVQGRHILPIFLTLPLVAGEVLYRNRNRVGPPVLVWLAAGTSTAAAVVQLSSWYTDMHRYAVANGGPWQFLGSADWSPIGGWAPWFALAAGGSALIVIAAFTALRTTNQESHQRARA